MFKGTEIHPFAKIIGMVDVYEALSHPRTYRKDFIAYEALQKIIQMRNTHFDPSIIKAMIKETIASGRFYLGFCLGHQLLSHVLGCRVGPMSKKSVGFTTGHLTPRGQDHPAFPCPCKNRIGRCWVY